jgi:excisionase family DNA binding protein
MGREADMSIAVTDTGRLLTTDRETKLARDVLLSLKANQGSLHVSSDNVHDQPIPPEIASLVAQVLAAVASGRTLTISAIPEVLTTSAAAALLGVSRPTLMKMIGEGAIPSHKVGSHTRLKSSDVLAARRARRLRERAAFVSLLEAEGDEIG